MAHRRAAAGGVKCYQRGMSRRTTMSKHTTTSDAEIPADVLADLEADLDEYEDVLYASLMREGAVHDTTGEAGSPLSPHKRRKHFLNRRFVPQGDPLELTFNCSIGWAMVGVGHP
jgi:hypothetical protein